MEPEPTQPHDPPTASDPASLTTAARAVAWAVAVQMPAAAVAWSALVDPRDFLWSWVSAAHTLLMGASAALAARFLAPLALGARSRFGVVSRCVGLGVVGGAFTKSTVNPLAHVGSTFSSGMTRFDFFLDDVFVGAFCGFFAGLFAATVVLRHRRLQGVAVLDRAPRIYLGTGASLIVPALGFAFLSGAAGAVLLLGGVGLMGAGLVLSWQRGQAGGAAKQAVLRGLASGMVGLVLLLTPFGLLLLALH